MRLTKILLLLIAILYCNGMSAQDVPIVEANVLKNTAFDETPEYKNYILLLNQLMSGEKELEKLDKQEVALMTKFDAYYPDGYNEMEAGWSVIGPGCSWYCGAGYTTRVSSSLASQGNNSYTEEALGDDDVRTAWVEGAKGYGVGEYIEFIFDYNAPRATSVTISNGYNKNPTTWKNNSRVKTLNIYEDDKLLMIVNLADTRDLQSFDLPHPIPNREGASGLSRRDENKPPVHLKMMISEVYKGDRYDDTAISEITFDGMDVHCLVKGTMITMGDMKDLLIENVKIGDKILVWNPAKKRMEQQEVVKIHSAQHLISDMIEINYRVNKEMKLILTADHPVYSPTGWLSANPSATANYKRYEGVSVGQLESNAILYRLWKDEKAMKKKRVGVIKKASDKKNTIFDTYTLELSGNGIFFANGFAVGQE